ncbi:MAG TPA: hypothetical protein VF577_07635 [Allosphingosinicella sp.]|jgi:hypothetical protein
MLKARLQPITASEQRAAPRRLVNLGAHLRGAIAEASDVRVLDLSREGCRISPIGSMIEGSQAWLKLPGLETIGCSVVWIDSEDAGLAFHRSLHDSDLESAKASRPQVRVRSNAFGLKGARAGS